MDKSFEAKICSNFFNKRTGERLYYELTSKKREEFFRKMSHTADWYLGGCILKQYKMPLETDGILNYLRTCLHKPSARLCDNLLSLPALKILEIRQYSCGFLPCHRQNLAANPHTSLVKTGSK